jgi:hypothetical protein
MEWHIYRYSDAAEERLGSKICISYNRAVCYDVRSSLHHNKHAIQSALEEEWGEGELWVKSPNYLVCRNFGTLWVPIKFAVPQNKKARENDGIRVKWEFPNNNIVYEIYGDGRYKLLKGDINLIEQSSNMITDAADKLASCLSK